MTKLKQVRQEKINFYMIPHFREIKKKIVGYVAHVLATCQWFYWRLVGTGWEERKIIPRGPCSRTRMIFLAGRATENHSNHRQ